MGEELFREAPAEADIVVPVPDSGIGAAVGYARASGLPLEYGLYKNPYAGRTFIQPTQELRDLKTRLKLSPTSAVRGKRVVLIDDSIVRGTTSRRIVGMLKEAGAKEVHFRVSVAPPSASLLLRHRHRRQKGAHRRREEPRGDPGLHRGRLPGLPLRGGGQAAIGGPVCLACFNGRYPAGCPRRGKSSSWR
jgi:amidophosphoribosyltransferase